MNLIRSFHRSLFLILMAMSLVLVACERPFQEDTPIAVPEASQPAEGENLFSPTEGEEGAVDGAIDQPAEGEAVEGATPSPEEEAPGAETGTEEAPAEETTQTTEDASTLPTNENGDRVYVVESGDTVGRIALLYGVTIEDIAAANPNLVSVDVLDVGQELVIPEPGFAESDQAAAPVTEPEEPGDEGEEEAAPEPATESIHVVSAGETIYSIGLLYGFTVEQLQAYNNLVNPNLLKIGDEIRIPPEGYEE